MSERCVIVRSLKEFRGITRGCTVRETAGNRSWSAVVDRALAPGSDTGAIPSGFRELDGMLGGFQPGSLTLICGQAGVGTSTLLLDIVRHNVFQREQARVRSDIFHRPCVTTLYSTDRTERDIAVQITAAQAKVRWHVVANGPTELEDALGWDRAMTWTTTNSDAPLRIMATPRLTLDTILDDLDTVSRPAGLIAIDPLSGLARAPRLDESVIDIARALKSAAMRLQVPIVATAGYAIVSYDSAFDTLSRVADTVLGLHRADLHDPQDPRAGEAELSVYKSRTGRTGTHTIASMLTFGYFAGMWPMG